MTQNNTTIDAQPGRQEIFITREFDAPRELVFKAFTDPELVIQWLSPKDLKMRIEKYEATKGGSYRYVHFRNAENEYGFNGVFHDSTAPESIIQTFEFEGLPEKGHVCLETTTFEALPGNKTKVVVHDVFQSVADRDGMLKSGMEDGLNQCYERLDDLVKREQGK